MHVLAGLLVILLTSMAFAQTPDILEVVEIGEINEISAQGLVKSLEAVQLNPRAKAILLVIDSPGGGVLATKTMYDALSTVKLPIAAWCYNLCASGGLYVAMAPSVTWIGARDITITGSMGVIMQVMRFNRLLDWAKIDSETYKSGELKDAGSPLRPVEVTERAYLQELVDVLAQQFYGIVKKARPQIPTEYFETLKSGRVVFGSEAAHHGLIDAVASREEAIKKAKEMSKSASIYTREELKKMSRAADESPRYRFDAPQPFMDQAVQVVQDVLSGERVRFLYLMPYRF